jgi:hypothetical protein
VLAVHCYARCRLSILYVSDIDISICWYNQGRADEEEGGNKQCTHYVGRNSLRKTTLEKPGCKRGNNKLILD